MTHVRKPASSKLRAVLKKLEALAERGVDGERFAAQQKIERLKTKYDFGAAEPQDTADLFRGTFKRGRKAAWIRSFRQTDLDIANAVKWAIEAATGIHCIYREDDLMAEATPTTARRLATIADTIASSFCQLISDFSTMAGASSVDRSAFVMGLYDGMMNTPRDMGQRLPGRIAARRRGRGKRPATTARIASTTTATLHVHPYTLAFGLGRQIRFSVPLAEITAELQNRVQPQLPSHVSTATGQRAAAADTTAVSAVLRRND